MASRDLTSNVTAMNTAHTCNGDTTDSNKRRRTLGRAGGLACEMSSIPPYFSLDELGCSLVQVAMPTLHHSGVC